MIGHSGLFVNLKSQNHGHLHTKVYRSGRKIQDHKQLRTNLFTVFCMQLQVCHEKRWMYCIYMHLFVFVYLCFYFFVSFLCLTYHRVTYPACSGWSMGESQRVSVWLACLCACPKYFDSSLPEYQPADVILWLVIQTWVPLALKHNFSCVVCFFYNIKKMFDLITVYWLGTEAHGVWWDGIVSSWCRETSMLASDGPGIRTCKKGWHTDLF